MKKINLIIALVLFAALPFAQAQTTGAGTVRKTQIYGDKQPQVIYTKPVAGIKVQSTDVPPAEATEHEHDHDHDHDGHDHEHGTCGFEEHQDQLRSEYPAMPTEAQFENFIRTASAVLPKSAIKTSAVTGKAVYQIPIIFHVVYYNGQTEGQEHYLTEEAIASQIKVLNEDFQRLENTRGFNNLPAGATIGIEFVPAIFDPSGNKLSEPGIHRVKANDLRDDAGGFLDSSQHYVTTATGRWIKRQTCWDANCYLNVWTLGLAGGVLGLGEFPDVDLPGIEGYDLTPPADEDGILLDYRRCGSYEKGPFPAIAQNSAGRTLTHEMGHFLGLRHTFGDAPTDAYGQRPEGCLYDDYVDDTPNTKAPLYNVTAPLYACGEREMLENYMDYSPEVMMNAFTKGQAERIYKVLANSPRRKQLLTSTVASEEGERTPVVTLKMAANKMYAFDVFTFEAIVERFPGTYQWEFQDGIPATSTKRTNGVYFTSAGRKQVKLTVSNAFGSVTKITHVDVLDVEPCKPVYKSTLETLPESYSTSLDPGSFATGHGNVFGIRYIASRFARSTNPAMRDLSQIEMAFNRFFYLGGYNADELFKVMVMTEGYDSIRVAKTAYSYEMYAKGLSTQTGSYTFSTAEERDALLAAYRSSPEMVSIIQDDATWFVARKYRPMDTLALQYVRVGDTEQSWKTDKPLLVKLDNPVQLTTANYFLVIDLDYDYSNATRRQYSFELKAGLSPINFSWADGPITVENARVDPTVKPYAYEWKPFSMPAEGNSWGQSMLMNILPVFTSDNTAFNAPDFTLPAQVAVGESATFSYDPANKPTVVTAVKWTIEKENGTHQVVIDKQSATYSFSKPGKYKVTLTFLGEPCLQHSTTKEIVVKGISFKLTDSRKGLPVYGLSPANSVQLEVVELFKSGSNVEYTWSGDPAIDGTTGLTKTVTVTQPSKYYVTARDVNAPSLTARDSVTIQFNSAKPIARVQVETPHLKRGDTLDIYVSDPNVNLTIRNLSENVSCFYNTAGKLCYDIRWKFEGVGSRSYMVRKEVTGFVTQKDYNSVMTMLLDAGPGMYKMTLYAANRHTFVTASNAAEQPLNNIVVKRDSVIVYLNLKGRQSFGQMEFTANGKPMSIVPPPAYSNALGQYNAYVSLGSNVTLEAVSDEIKSIEWVHGYNNSKTAGNSVTLLNVRDITSMSVKVTRERSNGQSKISYTEDISVIVYPDTYAPTAKAIASFSPSGDSICVGGTIKFINNSKNATGFRWEFSGGVPTEDSKNYELSNLWSPTLRFDKAGDYTAKLTVDSYDGTSEVSQRTITVGNAHNPRILYYTQPNPASAKIVNDTLFIQSRGPALVVCSGVGIEKIVSYNYFNYLTDEQIWKWGVDNMAKGNELSVNMTKPVIPAGQESKYAADHEKYRITARACDGTTIQKIFRVKFVSTFNPDDFQYFVNGDPQQLGDNMILSERVVCPGEALNLQINCLKPEVTSDMIVTWYRVNNDGTETLLASGFNYTAYPTENTTYKVQFVNKVGEGRHYSLPVMVNIDPLQLVLKNIDLTMTADSIVLPYDYTTYLVLNVNNLVKPQWKKTDSNEILSESNSVVLPPKSGRYEVSTTSANCTYTLAFYVKVKAAPIPEDGDDPEVDDKKGIEMYPIPAKTTLHLTSTYDGDAYILNSKGSLVKQFRLLQGDMELNVTDMASGVYRLVVQKSDGKIISRTFVVTR